jgi:putative transposase
MPGLPHHVTQRGNDRQRIFHSDADRLYYLDQYAHYARRMGVETLAYCLMDNHVHWVLRPESEKALAQTFHALDTKYAGRTNARNGRSGHLYQGRFFSAPLDDDYLWAAVRYVERNPVRARMVDRAEDYAWSSAAAHCGLRSDWLLSFEFPPASVIANWSEWLRTETPGQAETLRRQTSAGRPCGSDSFVAMLERALNRALRPQKRGPKPDVATPGQKQLF